MKFVTFLKDKRETLGLLRDGKILDISQALGETLTIQDVLNQTAKLLPKISAFESSLKESQVHDSLLTLESSTQILAPIPHPLSMRDGYAFRQHVESARKGRGLPMIPEFDNFPIYYYTNHLAISGPGEIPVQKLAQERLDFELEVAIVIGKEGRNIPAERADEHIFGYMILNDWSARELQTQEMKLNLGPAKGKDFSSTLGPYLVTRDELKGKSIPGAKGERHDLSMKAWVNGILVSTGNLKDMSWTFAQLIERVSYGVTLYPGEVIGSGTVGTGCFMELNGSKITDNQWLKPGDEVILEVDGLGKLVNRIVDDASGL